VYMASNGPAPQKYYCPVVAETWLLHYTWRRIRPGPSLVSSFGALQEQSPSRGDEPIACAATRMSMKQTRLDAEDLKNVDTVSRYCLNQLAS
jgi:hypothetical protein